MLTAAELYERGRDDASSGRLARARTWCLRALDRDPTPELSVRITVTLAYLDAERGDLTGGIGRCEEVLTRVEHTGVERGRTLAQLGLLRMRAGAAEQAVDAFRGAIARLVGHDEDLARVHLNRGNVYLQRYEPTAAERDFDDARRFAEHADKPVMRAKALHNRGYARMLRGELVGALDDLADARQTLEPISPVTLAVCDQDRAEVLLAAGLTDEAHDVLQEVTAVFARRRMRQQQAECELLLARLYVLADDNSGALRAARAAARRFAAQGSDTWALRAQVTMLAAEIGLGRTSASLVGRGRDLANALEAAGFASPAMRARLLAALAACRRGEVDVAGAILTNVRVTAATSLDNRLLAAQVRAEVAHVHGRRTRAHAYLGKALTALDTWQSMFGRLDIQAATTVHGQSCALLGLGLAVERGTTPALLEWTERARSLAGRVPAVRPPHDDEAATLLARLRAIRASDTSVDVAPLEATIRARLWATGARASEGPVTVEELRAKLVSTDSTYVAYFHTGSRLYGLAISARGERLVDLGSLADIAALLVGMPADLAMVATRTSASMHGVLVSSIRMRLQRLSERLWAPFDGLAGTGGVVLSATGALADVTWSLLPGLAGRPVTIVPSATAWARARPYSHPRTAGFVAGPRVERADAEVRRAAGWWGDNTILGDGEATADAVSKLASRVDLLHIAAHGRHSAQNPMFSAFELEDGPWFGYDIDHVDRIPTTVILSACELGRSTERWGQQAIGMATAWLHAGARCVVASPAPLNDELAYDLLGRVHARLSHSEPPASALADAVAETAEPVPLMCYGV